MTVLGGCRLHDLLSVNVKNVQDLGSAMLVTVPKNKTKRPQKFVVTEPFYGTCKKYADIRSAVAACDPFFLCYRNGKCAAKRLGTKKFSAMPKEIAEFLQLPDADQYNKTSFRQLISGMLDREEHHRQKSPPPVSVNEIESTSRSVQCASRTLDTGTVSAEPKFVSVKEEKTNTITIADCEEDNAVKEESLNHPIKRHQAIYEHFIEWRDSEHHDSFSEDVFLEYFKHLLEKFGSSSLWSRYFALRSVLIINHNVNMAKHSKVRDFLKSVAADCEPKEGKTFTLEEVEKFITEAPDETYLALKVRLFAAM